MSDIEVVIKIPRYEFDADIKDKFQDYFNRVKADIDCKGLCGKYEIETTDMFLAAFEHCIVLPKGHGSLKDEDEIYELLNSINGTAELDKAFEAVEQATTIIKADKEDENGNDD